MFCFDVGSYLLLLLYLLDNNEQVPILCLHHRFSVQMLSFFHGCIPSFIHKCTSKVNEQFIHKRLGISFIEKTFFLKEHHATAAITSQYKNSPFYIFDSADGCIAPPVVSPPPPFTPPPSPKFPAQPHPMSLYWEYVWHLPPYLLPILWLDLH